MNYKLVVLVVGALVFFFGKPASAAIPTCRVTPDGGAFIATTNVTVTCDSGVINKSVRWGSLAAKKFTDNSITVKYNSNADRTLKVSFTYFYNKNGRMVSANGLVTKLFKTGNNTCFMSPAGGYYDINTPVSINCGRNVTSFTYKWGDYPAKKVIGQSTSTSFFAKIPVPLLVKYNVTETVNKVKKVSIGQVKNDFSVRYCLDSDDGARSEERGNVIVTTNGKIENNTDVCVNGNTAVREYSCLGTKLNSQNISCAYGCFDGSCRLDAVTSTRTYKYDAESYCMGSATPCNTVSCYLSSQYFANDVEARALLGSTRTITLPKSWNFKERDLRWRIVNALQMLGYTQNGIMYGRVIDKNKLAEIDCRLRNFEYTKIVPQANKIPWFANAGTSSLATSDFKGNMPQTYAAYIYASVLDKYNSGTPDYVTYSEQCLLANLCPQMPNAIENGGDQACYPKSPIVATLSPSALVPEYKVNSQMLFGFSPGATDNFGIKSSINPASLPPGSHPETFSYTNMLVHEMVHEMDTEIAAKYEPTQRYKRMYCTNQFMNFYATGTPFTDDGVMGNQNMKNFVSSYASGMNSFNLKGDGYALGQYNKYEDVAESMTYYILLPEAFRSRLASSTILKAKYNFIKNNIFGGKEFTNPNLIPGFRYNFALNSLDFVNVNRNVEKFIVSDIY